MCAAAALPDPDSGSASAAGGDGGSTTTGGYGTAGGDDRRRGWLARLLAALDRLVSREVNVVPYVGHAEAARAAASRRVELEAAMRREQTSFHETPPGLPETGEAELVWGADPTTAAIAMAWQIQDNDFLLLARVTDYVRAALAAERLRPMIVLERLRSRTSALRPDLFEWRVVVRTPKPRSVRRLLQRLNLSPGIGVDVARAVPTRAQGSCRKGDGRRGVAPGRVRSDRGMTFEITCAHVVDAECDCAAWPPRHVCHSYTGPDAVLLREGSCLNQTKGEERRLVPAGKDEWHRLGRDPRVLRLGASGGNRHGKLRGPMAGFYHEDGWCEMPSLSIEPRRWQYGVVPWPLIKRAFSRKGDSGDWVVGGENYGIWLGMIVEGSSSGTIAHQAPALLAYFDSELGRHGIAHSVGRGECAYVAS